MAAVIEDAVRMYLSALLPFFTFLDGTLDQLPTDVECGTPRPEACGLP